VCDDDDDDDDNNNNNNNNSDNNEYICKAQNKWSSDALCAV